MLVIRLRLDAIAALRVEPDSFASAEIAAFHGRKVVEAIGFACLVAVKNGLRVIPREAVGQWSPVKVLRGLRKQGLSVLPSPSILRRATTEEVAKYGVKAVVSGVPERRLADSELLQIYDRLHRWLHELNPYVFSGRAAFLATHGGQLWEDLERVERFVERHFVSIGGQGFFAVLRDEKDMQTKVIGCFAVA